MNWEILSRVTHGIAILSGLLTISTFTRSQVSLKCKLAAEQLAIRVQEVEIENCALNNCTLMPQATIVEWSGGHNCGVLEVTNEHQSEIMTRFSTSLENSVEKVGNTASQLVEVIKTNDPNLISKAAENHTKNVEYFSGAIDAITSLLPKNTIMPHATIGEWGDSDLFGSITKWIENYNVYLTTLSVEQVGALAHILLSIGMLFSIFAIASILFGDFLLDFLKIEQKYPTVWKWLQIRRMFKTYSIVFHIGLIILILLVIIIRNTIVFLARF